jgi:hypothetical protein
VAYATIAIAAIAAIAVIARNGPKRARVDHAGGAGRALAVRFSRARFSRRLRVVLLASDHTGAAEERSLLSNRFFNVAIDRVSVRSDRRAGTGHAVVGRVRRRRGHSSRNSTRLGR